MTIRWSNLSTLPTAAALLLACTVAAHATMDGAEQAQGLNPNPSSMPDGVMGSLGRLAEIYTIFGRSLHSRMIGQQDGASEPQTPASETAPADAGITITPTVLPAIQLAGGDPDLIEDAPAIIAEDTAMDPEPYDSVPQLPQPKPTPAMRDLASEDQPASEANDSETAAIAAEPAQQIKPASNALTLEDATPSDMAEQTTQSPAMETPGNNILTLEDVAPTDAVASETQAAIDDGAADTPPLTLDSLVESPSATAETAAEPSDTAVTETVDAAPACFPYERVSLVDSTILPQDRVALMFGDEIGACITPDFIGSVLERLNGYYLDAGYVTTRAYITPQDLTDGTLSVTIVEGRLEEIRLNDNSPQDRRRIAMAFSTLPGDILNITEIDQGLSQLNRPASVMAKLNLVPGSQAGQTIVQIDEQVVQRQVRYKAGLDNSGSQSTGTMKSTLGIDADNLLSLNETVSLSHIGSTDTNALAGSITLPYGRNTVTLSGSYSDYLSDIDASTQIFGRTDTRELKINRALFKTATGDVKGEMSLTRKSSQRTINDLSLSPQRLTVLRMGMSYAGTPRPGISANGSLYLAGGMNWFDATRDRNLGPDAPRAQFLKIQADGSLTLQPRPGLTMQTNFAGQLAAHPLYGSEQISAGGKSSVRGFKTNSIAGDSGFYAQTDLLMAMPESITFPGLDGIRDNIQLFGGIDVGATRDLSIGKTDLIVGTGGGLRLNINGLSGEVALGAPIYRQRGSRGNRVDTYVKFLYSIAKL